jgi:heme exporter protein C
LEIVNKLSRPLFALITGVVTVWSFKIPPAENFQRPDLARIFIWHFPCPMIATILLMIAAWFSVKYLRTKDLKWDVRATAAHELSYVFSLLTMATGMLFSKMEWGAWWQWDPRQTSFLLVMLIYAALFALRGAITDQERRAANGGAYALAALMPALFLIFVFPRLPQVISFHPSQSIMTGQIKGQYAYAVTSVIILLSILSGWCYRLRVRAGILELRAENYDERLNPHSGDPTPSGVVRPVRLSSEN